MIPVGATAMLMVTADDECKLQVDVLCQDLQIYPERKQ
jgi:hypothetical protein